MTIDDLPVAGRVDFLDNFYMAMPTGHLGFLHASGIGEIVSRSIFGESVTENNLNVQDYKLDRFSSLHLID
jgi:glycine/D-amino acid oxidase-like deaminating enzyme